MSFRVGLCALRWAVAGVACALSARAHFAFSYSAVESAGLVNTVFPPGSVGVDPINMTPQPEHDYLRLQPLVEGYTWQYRGTFSNGRTTFPAELKVEVLSANRTEASTHVSIEYTVRHTLTLGTAVAVTTISGYVDDMQDHILSTRTVPADPKLAVVERTFVDGGIGGMPRKMSERLSVVRGFYGRLSEKVAGSVTDGLGARMGVGCEGAATISTAMGTFEALHVTQDLDFGSTGGVAPVLNSDGSISYFPRFISRSPDISTHTFYAAGVGPVRIAWTQSEATRETITGSMDLVATNFTLTPEPLRKPHVFWTPRPVPTAPGATVDLTAEVLGVAVAPYSMGAPSNVPLTNEAGVTFRWLTPRGDRWTDSTRLVLQTVTAADDGMYQLEVTNRLGSARTAPVRVMVTAPSDAGRLHNVGSRAPAGQAGDTLIAGIVLVPSPTQPNARRSLLFRTVGPTLRNFGVEGAEPDPMLVVYDSSQIEIARCDNWDTAPDLAARVAAASLSAGDFALPAGSSDAALVLDLPSGGYTAHLVSRANGAPAVGLIEIYDGSPGAPGPRITNLSTRCRVGFGEGILIPGIVVADGGARLLMRALGRSLSDYGVTDGLPDPEITLYCGNTPVAGNDDWRCSDAITEMTPFGETAAGRIATATTAAGALPLRSDKDSALVVTLPPGNYTLHVRSHRPWQTGVVIAEVFLMKP